MAHFSHSQKRIMHRALSRSQRKTSGYSRNKLKGHRLFG